MTDLIQRIETAPEPSRELFEEAFDAVIPDRHWPGRSGLNPWTWAGFTAMLDAQAWTSAAEMLLPANFRLSSLTQDPGDDLWRCSLSNRDAQIGRGGVWCYAAAHPSLALLAAILKANDHE